MELTKREIEVLNLLSKGFSCSEIAEKLSISETTIITHKKNLRFKLNATNSCQKIWEAVIQGYLEPKKSS